MGGGWLSYLGMAPSIYPRTAVPTEYHTNFTEYPNYRVPPLQTTTTPMSVLLSVVLKFTGGHMRGTVVQVLAYEGYLDVAHELDIAHVRHGRRGPI